MSTVFLYKCYQSTNAFGPLMWQEMLLKIFPKYQASLDIFSPDAHTFFCTYLHIWQHAFMAGTQKQVHEVWSVLFMVSQFRALQKTQSLKDSHRKRWQFLIEVQLIS